MSYPSRPGFHPKPSLLSQAIFSGGRLFARRCKQDTLFGSSLARCNERRRLLGRAAGCTVAFCPQEVHDVSRDVAWLASSPSSIACELRGRFDLDPHMLARWPTMSPGERRRWQIGAALACEPDVLLVDEPTNHLDAKARELLVATLRRFRGVGVVVSHDRALLETLPTTILRLHAGELRSYAGAYSAASAAWEAERLRAEETHARARNHARAIEERLARARTEHAAASRARSSRTRMKDKNDHDARGALAKGRAAMADAKAGRAVTVLRDALGRAEGDMPSIERDRTIGRSVFATYEPPRTPILFHVDERELRAGAQVIARDVRLTIRRDDRVRVVGANGAGKTTLLRRCSIPRATPIH